MPLKRFGILREAWDSKHISRLRRPTGSSQSTESYLPRGLRVDGGDEKRFQVIRSGDGDCRLPRRFLFPAGLKSLRAQLQDDLKLMGRFHCLFLSLLFLFLWTPRAAGFLSSTSRPNATVGALKDAVCVDGNHTLLSLRLICAYFLSFERDSVVDTPFDHFLFIFVTDVRDVPKQSRRFGEH